METNENLTGSYSTRKCTQPTTVPYLKKCPPNNKLIAMLHHYDKIHPSAVWSVHLTSNYHIIMLHHYDKIHPRICYVQYGHHAYTKQESTSAMPIS